ncbi:hypothetical protein [Amycolatopsis eburnea]|uniref:hypothetical protein n=1 Tax=Amycolatopsis eburnea TaxID=2267691 RepID=UPI0013159044|nr:hypothetical protein [Amycolatopsis eburnea]
MSDPQTPVDPVADWLDPRLDPKTAGESTSTTATPEYDVPPIAPAAEPLTP